MAEAKAHGPQCYEDVLTQSFLPPSEREPALARELRRLVWSANPAVARLLVVTAAELRRLEKAVVDEGMRRATMYSMRYLAPGIFGANAKEGDAAPADEGTLPAPAADVADLRPSAAYRAACPLRSRAEVVAQYGDPSEWQVAGRGTTKAVYYARCATPVRLADGSYTGGLVAVAVAECTDRARLELCNLCWVRDHVAGDGVGAGRCALPIDAWTMAEDLALPGRAPPGPARAARAADPDAPDAGDQGESGPTHLYLVFPACLSLLKLIQSGVTRRWGRDQFASVALQMLEPLAVLQRHSAVHRDIKPENTLLLPQADPAPWAAAAAALARYRRFRTRHLTRAAKGAHEAPGPVRVLLADWAYLRVRDDLEYAGADCNDRPILGTLGYQHFAVLTSKYFGWPWHARASDPSNARTRDVFAVGMTLAVAAVGQYLSDVEPRPSPATLDWLGRFVQEGAYVAGKPARAAAAKEVAGQWLHLHALEQLRGASILDHLPPAVAEEIASICTTSPVRRLLLERLGRPLCELTLAMLSAELTAEEALQDPALEEARRAAAADDLAGASLAAALATAVREGLPEALQDLVALAVVEFWGVCSRLPMATYATRALSPLVRLSRLDQLGCRALELTGVRVEDLYQRKAALA